MKTGKIRLKPGVIPHIFDCQKTETEQPCAGSSMIIKEEINIDESTLEYVKEEVDVDVDVPDYVVVDQLRIKQETDTLNIKIKEEILDVNEEIDTIDTDTLHYKIKEETLDIKEEPDSTTEVKSGEKESVRKKYCDKAVQVNLNLLNVRTIGIQCCLEENDVASSSEKRKTTHDDEKPKSKKKKIKITKK